MKQVLVGALLIVILLAVAIGGCVSGTTGGNNDNSSNGAAGQGSVSPAPGTPGAWPGASPGVVSGKPTAATPGGQGGTTSVTFGDPLLSKQQKITLKPNVTQYFEIRNKSGLKGEVLKAMFPEGAVSEVTNITAETPASLPGGFIPGTAIQFGPDGFRFLKPVDMTIRYNPAALPSGTDEASLRLCKLIDGQWKAVDGSSVDTATQKVSGQINGFSTYAVAPAAGGKGAGSGNASVTIDPIVSECPPDGQVILRTRLTGVPAGEQPRYEWYGGNGDLYWNGKYGSILHNGTVGDVQDTVIYRPNKDAPEGATEQIRAVVQGGTYDNVLGGYPILCQAYATVTIRKSAVSITFAASNLLNDLTDHDIAMTAQVDNQPAGPLSYEWSTPGDFGGLVNGKYLQFTSSQPSIGYTSNGKGQDHDGEWIYLSVYQVQGSEKRLIGNASTWVEIYKPTQEFSIYSDRDFTAGADGTGSSSWTEYVISYVETGNYYTYNYNVGAGGTFFARWQDELVIRCDHKGYGQGHLMIKKGGYDAPGPGVVLIPADAIHEGLNRTIRMSDVIANFNQ